MNNVIIASELAEMYMYKMLKDGIVSFITYKDAYGFTVEKLKWTDSDKEKQYCNWINDTLNLKPTSNTLATPAIVYK